MKLNLNVVKPSCFTYCFSVASGIKVKIIFITVQVCVSKNVAVGPIKDVVGLSRSYCNCFGTISKACRTSHSEYVHLHNI